MTDLQSAKQLVRDCHAALDAALPGAAADVLARHTTADWHWRGYHPFYEQRGAEAVAAAFWEPLRRALTSLTRRPDIFFAGTNRIDGHASVWVVEMGHLMGLFDAPWLGIRPTGKLTVLRYATFNRVEAGRIAETAMYFDIPHLMRQAGQAVLPPQLAAHLVQPGPVDHAGLLYAPQDPVEGRATSEAITRMVEAIRIWPTTDLAEIVDELRAYWTEDMLWWGPEGIGATYTIPRYAQQHAGPFRRAFTTRVFNGHIAHICEGHFGGFFGWPNLTLTHDGGFMGLPGNPRTADMRVIDIYRRSGDRLAENWVFIDLLHWMAQQGSDLLARNRDSVSGA